LCFSRDKENTKLDWAIIDIQHSDITKLNTIQHGNADLVDGLYPERVWMKGPVEAKIIAVTSSRVLSGTMSGTACYSMTPYCEGIKELWSIQVNGILSKHYLLKFAILAIYF